MVFNVTTQKLHILHLNPACIRGPGYDMLLSIKALNESIKW